MAIHLLPFDPVEFLTEDESITEYLNSALESEDLQAITRAMNVVARARGGIDQLALEAKVDPAFVSELLSGNQDSSLGLTLKLMRALGLRLSSSKVA